MHTVVDSHLDMDDAGLPPVEPTVMIEFRIFRRSDFEVESDFDKLLAVKKLALARPPDLEYAWVKGIGHGHGHGHGDHVHGAGAGAGAGPAETETRMQTHRLDGSGRSEPCKRSGNYDGAGGGGRKRKAGASRASVDVETEYGEWADEPAGKRVLHPPRTSTSTVEAHIHGPGLVPDPPIVPHQTDAGASGSGSATFLQDGSIVGCIGPRYSSILPPSEPATPAVPTKPRSPPPPQQQQPPAGFLAGRTRDGRGGAGRRDGDGTDTAAWWEARNTGSTTPNALRMLGATEDGPRAIGEGGGETDCDGSDGHGDDVRYHPMEVAQVLDSSGGGSPIAIDHRARTPTVTTPVYPTGSHFTGWLAGSHGADGTPSAVCAPSPSHTPSGSGSASAISLPTSPAPSPSPSPSTVTPTPTRRRTHKWTAPSLLALELGLAVFAGCANDYAATLRLFPRELAGRRSADLKDKVRNQRAKLVKGDARVEDVVVYLRMLAKEGGGGGGGGGGGERENSNSNRMGKKAGEEEEA
ncbi:hypothetical protein HDU93_003073 [Gonapodya sp. JEL0774]|nr:hypothetical protein HDU93_003073 [Gonapodya sp. JEL0774]